MKRKLYTKTGGKKGRTQKHRDEEDRRWVMNGSSSWEMFPPSQRRERTPQELRLERARRLRNIRVLIGRMRGEGPGKS